MPVPTITSQTGGAALPDVGTLEYNGIRWSSLYKSHVEGAVMQDDAKRTTKYMAYSLYAEGVVTLNPNQANTDANWLALRQQLTVHGGTLIYTGQGFGGLSVNRPGGRYVDVAWGPIPKILEFKPLGGGLGASIKWQLTTCVVEMTPALQVILTASGRGVPSPGFGPPIGGGRQIINNIAPIKPVLQWNYESSVTYDEDGYSGLSIRGVVEIPLTRSAVTSRIVADTVDSYRYAWENIQIDLTKFRVTRRNFDVSRDKRTGSWEYTAEEHTPSGLPAGSTHATGTFSVRNDHAGGTPFLVSPGWVCNLSVTYTVRKDLPRRVAYQSFCALLWWRMMSGANADLPTLLTGENPPQQPAPTDVLKNAIGDFTALFAQGVVVGYNQLLRAMQAATPKAVANVFMLDFGFTEGLHQGSKTATFEATWKLFSTLSGLLRATGIWRYSGDVGGSVWAASVQDIMGYSSWMVNEVNPAADLVVDFGGGSPPQAPTVV